MSEVSLHPPWPGRHLMERYIIPKSKSCLDFGMIKWLQDTLTFLCFWPCVTFCQVFETATEKQTEEGVQSTLQVEVTADIKVVCSASNAFGTDQETFNIKSSEFRPRSCYRFLSIVLLLKSLLWPSPPSSSLPALLVYVKSEKRLRLHLVLWFLWFTMLWSMLCCCCSALQLL